MSLKVTTPIKFSLTLINSDVHCILCRVYNRVDSSDISIDVLVFQIFKEKFYIKIPKSDYLYTYLDIHINLIV